MFSGSSARRSGRQHLGRCRVPGEEAKRLHVQREPRRRSLGPGLRRLGERDGVVRGVDFDQRELRRVVAQPALGAADALGVELLRRDQRLVAPGRGSDQDLHRSTLGAVRRVCHPPQRGSKPAVPIRRARDRADRSRRPLARIVAAEVDVLVVVVPRPFLAFAQRAGWGSSRRCARCSRSLAIAARCSRPTTLAGDCCHPGCRSSRRSRCCCRSSRSGPSPRPTPIAVRPDPTVPIAECPGPTDRSPSHLAPTAATTCRRCPSGLTTTNPGCCCRMSMPWRSPR